MSRLDSKKLSVEFRNGITATEPIIPRCYTLTHSDTTGEIYLTIAPEFAYDQVNEQRDEVLGEWIMEENTYFYYVYLYVDGQFNYEIAKMRNNIFHRELPLALEAIRYGDKIFFDAHPELDNSSIIVFFQSTIPEFNKVENWGTFSNYITYST